MSNSIHKILLIILANLHINKIKYFLDNEDIVGRRIAMLPYGSQKSQKCMPLNNICLSERQLPDSS